MICDIVNNLENAIKNLKLLDTQLGGDSVEYIAPKKRQSGGRFIEPADENVGVP